jgi:hypothetical protein
MEIVPTENVGRVQPFQTLFNLNLQLLTGLRETAKYLQIRASRSNHGLGSWAELKPSLLCRFRSEAIFSTRKGPPGPLPLRDANHHALTVDVCDLETEEFGLRMAMEYKAR